MIRATALFAVAGLVLTILLVTLWPARSEIGEPFALPTSASGALDGLSFRGMFGPLDGSSDRADVLHFRDGHFWSKNCVPCGFSPGRYKSWPTDEGVRFEGILTSPDRGRFHYSGAVRDGRVFARLKWRKERWYWTIDKDFRFEGVRAERSASVSAKSTTLVALAADLEPDECRP
jgi:hypothetical protein